MLEKRKIYIMSECTGETADAVLKSALSQFGAENFNLIRIPYLESAEQLEASLKAAWEEKAFVCHTLLSLPMRKAFDGLLQKYPVQNIDVLGPMLKGLSDYSDIQPQYEPGLIHILDQEYFKRIKAIEFAVKYDDGKSTLGLTEADIVLIGISRTSKTPLSMYLANKGLKAANVPLVPSIAPPEELFRIKPQRIVGLLIDPFKLNEIRMERLRSIGLMPDASYAKLDCITEEIEYSKSIMRQLRCYVIDVSNRAIEESAQMILEHHYKFFRGNNLL